MNNHQQNFERLFEMAPVAIQVVDRNGLVLQSNQACLTLLPPHDNIFQIFHEDQAAQDLLDSLHTLVTHSDRLIDYPATLKAADGSTLYVLVNAGCSEKGDYQLFYSDITERWMKQRQSNLQFEVTKVLVGATGIVQALELICSTMCSLLSCEIGIIWRTDERSNRMARLVHKVSTASEKEKHDYLITRSVNVPLSVAVGFPASVWFHGKPETVSQAVHATCFSEPSSRFTRGYPDIVAFPISIGSRVWGVISLFSTSANALGADVIATLRSIGQQIGHFVDRLEAYEAYLKSQERYYVAITGSNDGIWDWDLISNEVFYSPRYKAQLGFEESELANNFDTFRTLCHADDYQSVMESVQNHLRTKAPYESEFRCRTKSGDYKWICARGQAIWDNQGRPIRMAGSHRDISELKAAETARIEYEKRLSQSESMFRQLAENIREVFLILSAAGENFIYASPAFEELWQESCEKLYGDSETFFKAIIDEDRDRIRQALKNTSIAAQGFDLEFRIEGADKQIRWIWSRLFPVSDKQGSDRLYGIAHDITEKKEVEKRVSEFYSTVSHELRTPLTSIRAALGLIEGGLTGAISDETMEYVSIARNNSDRLIRLINDILDIRRLEANKLEINLTAISPRSLIEATVDSLRAFAEEKSITIRFQSQSVDGPLSNSISSIASDTIDDCRIIGDYDRTVQVLTNLISNAIKYTPAGKSVFVLTEKQDGMLKIKIKDEGPGIAGEHLPDLFGLFQQLTCIENEMNTGSGLGLAISKALIEKQHGEIGAESIVGDGATFWFTVPLQVLEKADIGQIADSSEDAEPPQHAEIHITDEAKNESQESWRPLILLMEDSDSIALILNKLIVSAGYDCVRAANLNAAREEAEKKRPDLLFADINLPDGNGLDFVNWLHERYSDHATPVIVLSGAEANISRVNHPSLVDWVRKPFEAKEILSLVKSRVDSCKIC